MEVNQVTRSLSLPPSPVVPSDTPTVRAAQEQSAEAVKVTAAPASGDSASQGGTSGEPGLGNHIDLYDTQAAKMAAEKGAQAVTQDKAPVITTPPKPPEPKVVIKKVEMLGDDTVFPEPSEVPPSPEFPYLKPLGPRSRKQPGQSFDATA